MSKNFIIKLNPYPYDVMVSFNQTDKQLQQYLKKYNCEWHDLMKFEGSGRFYINSNNQSLIRIANYPKSNEDFGTLQHEIFHCVTYVLDRIGMKLKLHNSDEAYAYLIGYLTTEIYKNI
jgi:hypothetical protein